MGRILSNVGLLGLIGVFMFSGAAASTTASVTATVTVQNISVTVADGSITYGTMGQNATKSTIAADLNDSQTATNAGNVIEDFQLKGTNSANWTLSATASTDKYIHKFCTSSCGSPPTSFTQLSSQSFTTLASSIATSSAQTFDLYINTPNPSSVFTQQSVNVTVQATAH